MTLDPYFSTLTRESLCRMARHDERAAEWLRRTMRDPMPAYLPAGEQVGRIIVELHTQRVAVLLLSTGQHARSFWPQVGGQVLDKPMGLDRIWSSVVSPRVVRPMSMRRVLAAKIRA